MDVVGHDFDCGGLFVGYTSFLGFYWSIRRKGAKISGGVPGSFLLHLRGLDDFGLLEDLHSNCETAHAERMSLL